jgi:hypothetical protein
MALESFPTSCWRKSSKSNGEQVCVEVAFAPDTAGIRDSKNPHGGHLTTSTVAFGRLLTAVKSGALDPH